MNLNTKFIIFVYICSSVKVIYARLDSNKFERKIIALRKVLKYIIERPEQMNLDAAIGVTFTEANIQAALQHKNIKFLDSYQHNALQSILKLSKDTRYKLHDTMNVPNDDLTKEYYENSKENCTGDSMTYIPLNLTISSLVNNPGLWIKPITWKTIKPNSQLQLPSRNLTLDDIFSIFFYGHPQEKESDECLAMLTSNCILTDKCRDFIVHHENSSGYPLTHKLLLVQVMKIVGCKTSITKSIPYLSFKFCSSILQELNDLEAHAFPSVSKDLASEQMLLCGMEGFLDFLDNHYEQLILDWQHPSGCFSGIGDYPQSHRHNRRLRREAFFTDYNCVNHATGLGAAALALFIRKDVEMMI